MLGLRSGPTPAQVGVDGQTIAAFATDEEHQLASLRRRLLSAERPTKELQERPSRSSRGTWADFFKTLGHPARIRILELLRDGERPVSQLLPEVGLEASHLSQQLAVLRRSGLVETRKEGSSVLYSVTDPRIFELLEVAKAILTTSLSGTQELLSELASLEFVAPVSRRSRPAR